MALWLSLTKNHRTAIKVNRNWPAKLFLPHIRLPGNCIASWLDRFVNLRHNFKQIYFKWKKNHIEIRPLVSHGYFISIPLALVLDRFWSAQKKPRENLNRATNMLPAKLTRITGQVGLQPCWYTICKCKESILASFQVYIARATTSFSCFHLANTQTWRDWPTLACRVKAS